MSKDTKIQWCHHTWNRWRGCRKVSLECEKCYIVHTPPFRITGQKHGSERVEAGLKYRLEPLEWNAAAEKAKERRRVFCMSLGDIFDMENVPLEWWVDAMDTIRMTPWLDWLLLTKRPQNFNKRMLQLAQSQRDAATETAAWAMAWEQGTAIPHNVWIGVSAGVDPSPALDIPAVVHFLSCEPMIKPLDTAHARWFDWIIFGGESGPGARPMDMKWLRQGLHFCGQAGIPAFVKQFGACPLPSDGKEAIQLGICRDKKLGNIDEWHGVLNRYRIRQFPRPLISSPKYD